MVLDNFRTIELIWDKANKSIIKTIKTASSDTTGRYFSVKILDDGQEVALGNAALQLYWEHPNFNTSGTDDFSIINNGGLFNLTFSDEMLTNIGELNAHLVLTLSDGTITSDGFPIKVFKGADDGVVVPTNGNGLVEQVANKIDKGNVTMSDLTQEVKEALTGGAVAVVGKNSVGTENIKDNAVTIQKAEFIHKSKNLFDKNKAEIGKMWASVDGHVVLQDNALLSAHPAIPVSSGEIYYKNGEGHVIITDENGYTLYTTPVMLGVGAHTVPENGAYMYTNAYTTELDTSQIEKGSVETSYEPFGITLDKSIKIESDSVDLPEVDLTVKQDKLVSGENIIIDQDNVISAIEDTGNPKMAQVNSAGYVTVYVPIEKDEYASYTFRQNTYEDYMKMSENGVYALEKGVSLINFGEVEGGVLNAPTTFNPYATTVGTKVITNFFGNGIKIITYADNRGGAWKISIDGEDYGTYSTWSDVVVDKKTLFEKLDLLTSGHTIVLEFIGADPNNVVTSPRGWLKMAYEGAWEAYGDPRVKRLTPKFELTHSSSNKEFAFNVSPADQSVLGEWFPQHNNTGTTTIGTKGIQRLELDGQVIDVDTPSELIEFEYGTFSQVAYSKLSSETDDRAKIVISYNFEKTVKQYFEMEFLKDSIINKGYAFMLPSGDDFANQYKTSARETKQTQTVTTDIDVPFNNININEFIATSNNVDKSSYFVRAKWENTYSDPVSAFLQSRANGIQKAYPLFFESEPVSAGTIVYFDGEWEIGKMKNANEIYG